jgi:tetratricopeptide (TPR) repeat protein
MTSIANRIIALSLLAGLLLGILSLPARAEVKAWQGTITIPTYPWEEDPYPKFWALEESPKLSTTVRGAITYPYTMQDHLLRTKVDRTYKALFLENEYLKVTCLPELGGRLHSVLDKTQGQETFHLNHVIKPSMIALRGAFISGGVEWNAGPQGHTVTIVSPVDALVGENPDGSAFLEVSNQEMIFRTRWTVRVTLHPGRAYLDERIRIANPADGIHPYYFWNCTAFPNRPGTRFIYPMTLGTDHFGRKFFNWPVHEGKDLSWLKNWEIFGSCFAVGCQYDFFGAYDVEADRGVVQVANHHELPGKKAWTWGTWDFGLVSQKNLTDDDGPYIEVQSGPLPTQSDYGLLVPREQIAWQEWWYPVHGLGDGFEYATRDVAVQSARKDGTLHLRLLATGKFPGATCTISRAGKQLLQQRIDLSPEKPAEVALRSDGQLPADVSIAAKGGRVLAAFTTPLPIPKTTPPDPAKFAEKPDEQRTADELCMKGERQHRDTNRRMARAYYEKALAKDPGLVPALRMLAVLDLAAGLYDKALPRLEKALDRDPNDGFSWYFRGVCQLRLDKLQEALDCGCRAARCSGTASLGYDLAGRAHMRLRQYPQAVEAFLKAGRADGNDSRAKDHELLARMRSGDKSVAERAAQQVRQRATDLVPRAVVALQGAGAMDQFVRDVRGFVGEHEFNVLELSLVFAEVGMYQEASRLLSATYVDPVPQTERNALPLYYLAYFAQLSDDKPAVEEFLRQAAAARNRGFASRPEEVAVLQLAVANRRDATAHLQLGNVLAGLGRVEEAIAQWQKATESGVAPGPGLAALRNLALASWKWDRDLEKAAGLYRRALGVPPQDQTLYRDLAEILLAAGKRPEAIQVLQSVPTDKPRRSEITIALAQAYLEEERYDDTIKLLDSTPNFVNWEGQDVTWRIFNRAHIRRGRQHFEKQEHEAALTDFSAALSYPANLNVGRSNRPEESPALYWKGKALEALGRRDEARAAWQQGASLPEGSGEQSRSKELCSKALAGPP